MNSLILQKKLIFACTIIFLSQVLKSEESSVGYRVETSKKTVIQISRDVYGDERLWKKIAQVNQLVPPYQLSIGQVLVLPLKPKFKLSNLIYDRSLPQPNFSAKLPDVDQVIEPRQGYVVYIVNERAPSLSMVALENFGDKGMAKWIARWNGLAADERLSLSQRLVFRKNPTQTKAQADKILIAEWIRVGNSEMAERIAGIQKQNSGPIPPVAKPVTEPAAAPISSVAERVEASVDRKPAEVLTALPIPEPVQAPRNESTEPATETLTTVSEVVPLKTPVIQENSETSVEKTTGRLPEKIVPSKSVSEKISDQTVSVDSKEKEKITNIEQEVQVDPEKPKPIAAEVKAPGVEAKPSISETRPTTTENPSVVSSPGSEVQPEEVRKPAAVSSAKMAPSDASENVNGEPEPTSESYWLGSDINRILKTLSKSPNE